MKTALILAGAITLVLISMERPASGSPAPPPPEAIASPMSDSLNDNEGLVRQKRGWGTCRSDRDCYDPNMCCGRDGICHVGWSCY